MQLADEGPTSDPGVGARHERPNGQHAAPARNLSRLLGANGPQSARRERVDHSQVGDALARLCIAGQEVRSGHHQRPQCQIPALATLARHREPVPVPFRNFSENEHLPYGTRPPVWFALDETRPLAGGALVIVARGELRLDIGKQGRRRPCSLRRRADVVCAVGKKAPPKAGPQYLLHEGVPAKGSPS